MRCNQCGKEIPSTNTHSIVYNGVHLILCGKHYTQYIKYGHFLDQDQKSIQDANEYEITPEGVYIYTFNRRGEPSGRFMIDLDDLEKVLAKKWRFWKGCFMTGNTKPIQIHRFLLDVYDENLVVDHINGDRSDNRRRNLRITTQQKNLINKGMMTNNSSEIAGVWYDKERRKWVAEIRINNIKCQLGRYQRKELAVFARYYSELVVFKEFRSNRNDQRVLSYVNMCTPGEKNSIILSLRDKLSKKYNLYIV